MFMDTVLLKENFPQDKHFFNYYTSYRKVYNKIRTLYSW